MAPFEWKNEYSLGHTLIDQQHKQLFVLANSVYNISISDKNRNDLEKILHELKDYTIYHFQTEEDIYFEKIQIES
jgi:hemerythrin